MLGPKKIHQKWLKSWLTLVHHPTPIAWTFFFWASTGEDGSPRRWRPKKKKLLWNAAVVLYSDWTRDVGTNKALQCASKPTQGSNTYPD